MSKSDGTGDHGRDDLRASSLTSPSFEGGVLGLQVPEPYHFRTKVARILFDMGDPDGRLPISAQQNLSNAVARVVVKAARGSARWAPILQSIDRWAMTYCAGSIKREMLAEICARAPHLLNSMPQCRNHVQALSRALFLSSVLHPAALKRIEDAVLAERDSVNKS